MATRLTSVVIDAADPAALGRFWASALGWSVTWQEPDEVDVEAEHGPPLTLVFVPVPEAKTTKNRLHLDLSTDSASHHTAEVARLRELGATPADIGQGNVPWTVLADPEGNEFCVLDPRERYEGAGRLAAVVVDARDPPALGRFWSQAAGWPVIEETPEHTALRAPSGTGPFLEFLRSKDVKTVKHRLHLDVAPFSGDDHAAEVNRLRDLGATPADVGQGDVTWVVLADPEGGEFCVLSPR